MNVLQKMFIIAAIICQTCSIVSGSNPIVFPVDESDDCDCDVLQITGPDGSSHNFTKQDDKINGKPYFFSMRRNMISWDNEKWSYDKYSSKSFVPNQRIEPKSFSFELMCKYATRGIYWKK